MPEDFWQRWEEMRAEQLRHELGYSKRHQYMSFIELARERQAYDDGEFRDDWVRVEEMLRR